MSDFFKAESAVNYEQKSLCVLLLDVSYSMYGKRLESLQEGIEAFHKEIMEDQTSRNRLEVAIITYGNNVSVLELSEILKKIFRKKLKIEWYGSKDKRSYFMSFEKIKKLGFEGKFRPEDGVKEILYYLNKKIISLDEKTITLEWYEKLEKWNEIINKTSINKKMISL